MTIRAWVLACSALLVCGCEQQQPASQGARKGPVAALITATQAKVVRLEVTDDTVGTLENTVDPRVGAEVAGRLIRVLAGPGQPVKRGELLAEIDSSDQMIQGRSDAAEIARLETLLANQDRIVERQAELVKQKFVSQNSLDDATATRNALREQILAARAKADAGSNALRKTRVLSPIDGRVEQQMVNSGDFVKVGDPLFRLVGTLVLRAYLPFPESFSNRIKVGLPVRLSSPLVPGKVIESRISEIRPTITATSRALNAIVQFTTDGSFVGGGTVNAQVVTSVKDKVVVVPEQSVVLRPAGKVVYLVSEGRALQRVVETGFRKDGQVEVVSGLEGGETVALDGAGFLTHNAAVSLPQPRGGKAGKGKKQTPASSEESAGKDSAYRAPAPIRQAETARTAPIRG